MQVPFLDPSIDEEDIDNLVRSIRSGWLVPGPCTEELEERLAGYLGAKHVVMMASCTAALHIGLILAGIKEGDEVITTPCSWVATSNTILYQKAKPVFVDVEPDTALIDVTKIEEKITAKTKAISPVHIYGQMADMTALKKIADKYHIPIIEDAAHSLEARRDGHVSGEAGFCAALSFHVAKSITSGQGGALVLDDSELAERARLLRRHGVRTIDEKRYMFELGYKYEPTDFQAALLVGQLARIRETHERRLRIYRRYAEVFSGNAKISFLKTVPNSVHAAHVFVIFVDPRKRDAIREKMSERGIETSIHYEPIHLEPYYRKEFGFKEGDFPVSEKLGASNITLPTFSRLTDERQDYVIDNVLSLV